MLTRKELFTALANDEKFETLNDSVHSNDWHELSISSLLSYLAQYPNAIEFPYVRVKSKTVTKTVTFPTPLKTAPKVGTYYYYVTSHGFEIYHWNNDEIDNKFLERGGVHLSEENAEKHYKAIQSLFMV